jgi:phosphatidate phosphatase APP1
MSKLRRRLTKIASGLEDRWDDFTFELKKRLRLNDPIQIVTFRTYGSVNKLHIRGRVLESKNIHKSSSSDSLLKNIKAMYQRFETDEIPGAKLKIKFEGKDYHFTTDHEGYFVMNLVTETPLEVDDLWHELNIELEDAPVAFEPGVVAIAEVMVPPTDAEFGIISDIDDTIVKTTATSLLAMARNTFFHNAHTRLPFAGVAEFYRALQLGRNGKRNNPFFYVSSSPWNLYDLLIDFLDLNEIPEGPLLLRDFGLDANKAGSSDHMGHKFKEISNILNHYPQLQFVLVGDSGQEDPVIYTEVVKQFPGRILAVYIRDVQLPDREKIAIEISKTLEEHKVEMVIVDNSVEAAEHASKIGLIYNEALPKIQEDKKQDKGETPGKETLEVVS